MGDKGSVEHRRVCSADVIFSLVLAVRQCENYLIPTTTNFSPLSFIMFENGFDTANVFRHPVFLVTFIVAIPAWIIAFASQCAAEAKLDSGSTSEFR